METVRLLNLDIQTIRFQELLVSLEEGMVFTPNVDHLMRMQRDRSFWELYQKAEYRVCDSRILLAGSQWLGTPIIEQIAGSDFFPAFCAKRGNSHKIFLLGGSTPETASKAQAAFPDSIVAAYSPPMGFETNPQEHQKILTLIRESGADTLAVGVGSPKQENWIVSNRANLPQIRLFFAVGKTIDFMGGASSRAPKWMQRAGLEWAYRLLQEPQRLAKRYLVTDLPFFWLIWKQKKGSYHNPWK